MPSAAKRRLCFVVCRPEWSLPTSPSSPDAHASLKEVAAVDTNQAVVAAFDALIERASGATPSNQPLRLYLAQRDNRWGDSRSAWPLAVALVEYSRAQKTEAQCRAADATDAGSRRQRTLLSHV